MGGTGGYSGYGSISTSPPIESSKNESQSSQRELEINEYLASLLQDMNNRDVDAIHTHLNEIEKTLDKEIDGLEKILFGGSILKCTFIEGASDVDALVLFNSREYKSINPEELQRKFATLLKNRFPRTEIVRGNLAVTVKFSDYDVQLLPAIKEGTKIRIADGNRPTWSAPIDVKQFTKRLTKVNQNNSNKVVPVIKLVKKLFTKIPERYRPSGYHVEAMAAEYFSTYTGRNTLYDMTKHFLDASVKRVLRPISDITGQSSAIDSDLGPNNSISRQKVSHQISELAGRFSNDDIASFKNEIFGG